MPWSCVQAGNNRLCLLQCASHAWKDFIVWNAIAVNVSARKLECQEMPQARRRISKSLVSALQPVELLLTAAQQIRMLDRREPQIFFL